jgi:hypothetical protein
MDPDSLQTILLSVIHKRWGLIISLVARVLARLQVGG